VRDAITTARKVIDHIADRVADRVTRTDKGNDGERADAEN
jgi:hypothetical protein